MKSDLSYEIKKKLIPATLSVIVKCIRSRDVVGLK